MTDYSELVDDLRDIGKTMFALGTTHISMDNVSISLAYDKRWGQTANDAAAAIEELKAIAHSHCVAASSYWEELEELKAQLPKRGEWVLTNEEIETIRIHMNAIKEQLCNQYRHREAETYQTIVDKLAKMEAQDGQ